MPRVSYWPSRDPIDENGGLNLYGFVFNEPTGWVDIWGREPMTAEEQEKFANDIMKVAEILEKLEKELLKIRVKSRIKRWIKTIRNLPENAACEAPKYVNKRKTEISKFWFEFYTEKLPDKFKPPIPTPKPMPSSKPPRPMISKPRIIRNPRIKIPNPIGGLPLAVAFNAEGITKGVLLGYYIKYTTECTMCRAENITNRPDIACKDVCDRAARAKEIIGQLPD